MKKVGRMAVVFVSSAGVLACAARSARPADPALSPAAATWILETTETFADTAVGFDGGASAQACAFAVLLRERNARDLFHSLLANGGVAGQLYALCGLYLTDPAAFRESVEAYRGRTDEVNTFMGCQKGRQRVGELVEHPGRAGRFFLDIYGGGYPASFRALRPCRGKE
jgi:hypothetical protein